MKADLLDFGTLKVVRPEQALTRSQWSAIWVALGLAGRNAMASADMVIDSAGLMTWPPKKRRTTRPWTDDEVAFVMGNHSEMDSYHLGRTIGRSTGAVEEFLRARGCKAMRVTVGRERGQRIDVPHWRCQDDKAHIVAVLDARSSGFAWGPTWAR